MRRSLLRRIEKLNKNRRQRQWWQRAVRTMAGIVVFCTTYALILPAITIGEDPVCGLEEHVHSDSCYTQQPVIGLGCPADSSVLTVHSHDALCLDDQGVLRCGLPEVLEHTHGEDCYDLTMVCTAEHLCDENCVTTEQVLLCTEESEDHIHEDACYEIREIPCALIHSHEESCYIRSELPTCGKQEVQTHIHEENCYLADGTLDCTKPVVYRHIHTEDCLVETEQAQLVLSCGMEEHIHTEECYPVESEEDQSDYFCGAGEHTHVETCYDEEGELICTIPEHSHEAMCQVELDLTADVETAQQWEAAFAGLALTENWPEDLLAVAQTQLNYKESEKNVIQTEEGLLKGYTRYGAWYGDPYGDWNTMFAAFCLHYAGVEGFPVVLDHDQWIEELIRQEMYLTAEQCIPKPGDLVFIDWDQMRLPDGTRVDIPVDADQMGILAERIAPTQEAPAQIRIIAADAENRVKYLTYEMEDPAIIGYGILPEAPEGKYTCGMTGHSHCWLCMDADGNVNCMLPEHTHTADCSCTTLTYEDGALRAAMTIRGFEEMPEDLTMQILPVTEQTDTAVYGAMVSAVGETMADSAYYVDDAVFYQVELMSGEAAYSLPEYVQTSLQVTMQQPAFAPEDEGGNAQLRTFTLVEEAVEIVEEVYADAPMLMMAIADDPAEADQPTASAEDDTQQTVAVNYQATELSALQEPQMQLSFTTENATVFGVALADAATVTGNWKRVTSTAELTADGTYLIISAEGNHVLGYNGTGTKVYIDSIKANEDYYHITTTNATDGAAINLPAAHWKFSGSGNSFTVRSETYNNYYLEVSFSYATRQTGSWSDRDGIDALTLNYLPQEGAWTFYDDNYYLRNNNSTSFGINNGTSLSDIRSRSMLIFRLVNESLSVPEDVVVTPDAGVGSEIPEKPSYPGYVDVSGGKTGETSYAIDANTSISGSYYSDPSTSKLESHFSGDTADDGMVHTDKSVIYGDDDYNAFATYEPNTFGVTLSALGQEFISGEQDYIQTPVDVMFVLDISGSMNAEKVPGSSTTTRSMAMVEAVNKTIAEIMDRNPDNRVGAVLYSSGTGNLLELGRYTEANDNFLEMRQGSWTSSSGTFSGSFIYPNDTLYWEGGSRYQDSGTYAYQFNGTYIQAGIALGAQKLMAVEDITTDVKAFEGTDNETTIRVRRQPVIILLSDGEPTHSTSNYKDVLAGPHYGDGLASSADYRGVHGYYTVLSANYYKRMVGIHYHVPAHFYSVGMGINATGATPSSSSDDAYYKRAVLDPTAARVQEAYNSSNSNAANTSRQLYQLLNNTYLYNTIAVTADNQGFMPAWIGRVHEYVPVIKNPYLGNYSYADGAYFGNYNAQQLADTFGEILDATETISPYGFVLRSRTSMKLDDPLGEGMEVKGNPVLRYGGINYYVSGTEVSADGSTVTYRYNGFYESTDGSGHTADLSKVTVKVITDANGLQTVHMDIPDYILPAYAPYTQGFKSDGTPYFYYEELPIRLIYQVGLTAEAEQELEALYEYGGSAVYYTNRYEGDTIAKAEMLPTSDNPYYMEHASTTPGTHENCHHTDKNPNTTGTITNSFECHHALVSHNGAMVPEVTQKLGNNGKLVFASERKVIDIPVQKSWQNSNIASQYESVEIRLYRVENDAVTYVTSLTLDKDSAWKGIFERMPLLPEGGYYFLTEVVPPGLAADYSGEKTSVILDGRNVWGVKINGQNPVLTEIVHVTNSVGYALPQTGGSGTSHLTFGGWLMIAAACVYFVIQTERKYRKGGVYRKS